MPRCGLAQKGASQEERKELRLRLGPKRLGCGFTLTFSKHFELRREIEK
jgi:hypothetical protein